MHRYFNYRLYTIQCVLDHWHNSRLMDLRAGNLSNFTSNLHILIFLDLYSEEWPHRSSMMVGHSIVAYLNGRTRPGLTNCPLLKASERTSQFKLPNIGR